MTFLIILRRLLFIFISLLLHSCFLIKVPVYVQAVPIKDTVNVYHFILTNSYKKIADTTTTNAFVKESKKAYDWITEKAKKRGQNIIFKEHWVANKDTVLNYNFVHKLPSNSLQILTRKKYFRIVTRKKTKTAKEKVENIDWKSALFDSIAEQIKDSSINKITTSISNYKQSDNKLLMIHLLKVKKSGILGFYSRGKAFIGNNKSSTIAHESLHYLGAPDLYIHRYWFGRRRRIVKKELRQEIMDFAIGKSFDCNLYYISNYIAYTLKWDTNLEKKYKPLLKQNLMAKFVFNFGLLF